MSRRQLRQEKDCLNCGAKVEKRYCSVCGQENIINRPSFGYLFTTFFQDLINYDSNFWRTLKTLLFRPGVIVLLFLVGRRKAYVNPIKLYFFVSLIAFLVPDLFKYSDSSKYSEDKISAQINLMEQMKPEAQQYFLLFSLDSIQNNLKDEQKADSLYFQKIKPLVRKSTYYLEDGEDSLSYKKKYYFGETSGFMRDGSPDYLKAQNAKQLDSIHRSLPKEERINWFYLTLSRKFLELEERDILTKEQFLQRFQEAFYQNFPKVLIFYLPVFAFVLWLFHNKRKWKYYDHGVFTLYFFSFLLIAISIGWILDWSINFIDGYSSRLMKILGFLIFFPGYLYLIFYFFRAHSKVYGDKKWISRLKAFMILGINIFLFLTVLLIFTIYTFWVI